jgi:hypothetical protein
MLAIFSFWTCAIPPLLPALRLIDLNAVRIDRVRLLEAHWHQ